MTLLDIIAVILVPIILTWFITTVWRLAGKNELEQLADLEKEVEEARKRLFD